LGSGDAEFFFAHEQSFDRYEQPVDKSGELW
jgi:hypothetical protein